MQASTIVAYIGLACSCALILALVIFAVVDFKSVNRVTIRLVIGLAVADLLTHISSILANGTKHLVGTRYCESLAAVTTLNRHLYSFTNIAISYHLYRVIIQLKKPSFKSELAVWIALVVIITVLMTIYHFLGVFNGTLNKKSCNPGANNPTITKVVFGLIGLFNFVAIVSGVLVTVVGHRYLARWIETYSDRKIKGTEDKSQFKEAKLKATKRSFLYPLSALVTLSAEVVLCVWMLVSDPPLIIYNISSICTGTKGILTLLTFSLDQAVWSSAKSTYDKLKDTQLHDI